MYTVLMKINDTYVWWASHRTYERAAAEAKLSAKYVEGVDFVIVSPGRQEGRP